MAPLTRSLTGREYYQRGEAGGYRNGYRPGRLKTAEGEVPCHSPHLRGTDAGALAALRELLAGRKEGLEALALELFARGCSTRDVGAAFTGEDGRPLLSKSAVSELTERLWAEYEAFATRDLSEIRPLYLCIDGIAERLMPGFRRWGPAAVRCFQEDCDACIAQPQLPVSHRRMACTTQPLGGASSARPAAVPRSPPASAAQRIYCTDEDLTQALPPRASPPMFLP